MSAWLKFFPWLREPGALKKVSAASFLSSLWFLAVYALWYFEFFLRGGSFPAFFSHFKGWMVLAAAGVPPAAAGVCALGYFKHYALLLLEKDSAALPDFEDPRGLFASGLEVLQLLGLVFSPSALALVLAAFDAATLTKTAAEVSLGKAFGAVFLLILASVFFFVSLAGFPVCFFRLLESDELSWVLRPALVWEDAMALGLPFWRPLFFLGAVGFLGETLALGISLLLAVSPAGILAAGVFFILTSSCLISILSASFLKTGADLFKTLHYTY